MQNIKVIVFLIVILNSCQTTDNYFRKINKNINDFHEIINYIDERKIFTKMDSVVLSGSDMSFTLNSKCVYYENSNIKYSESMKENSDKSVPKNDSVINEFMKKYKLDRICFEKRKDTSYYHKVIHFHKDHNPIFGVCKNIDYDFGNSPLRNRIENGMKKEKSYRYKTMDNLFIYSINKKPAFGE
ncbi:MAG: hypothetical protein LBE36_10055 [Flavobacteriaceae bacterium]|jgi:hypothetical protein|nr:hypothetical protein [Flavobacteriaceae bacterium]